jgi:hypothetical protein
VCFVGVLVDEESIRNFETSVTRASAINNAILIIGGDMNFPGWNWKENTLKPNSTAPNLHTDFMDVLNNNALTQLVEEPTRQQNTLDLIVFYCRFCYCFFEDIPHIGYLAVIVLEHI